MRSTIWEVRFRDGRGTSLYTDTDVTRQVGQAGVTQVLSVAARVSDSSPLADARRCFAEDRVVEAIADMGAVAYVLRHDESSS